MNLFKKTTLIIKLITKHYMRRGFLLLTIVVSLLSCNNNVEGVYNGHEYVDLGLSVMWSTTNVGAELSEDYGDYYAWGETQVKQSYSWTNYKYRISGNDFDNVKLSKYEPHDIIWLGYESDKPDVVKVYDEMNDVEKTSGFSGVLP